jgi:hypothetical protein
MPAASAPATAAIGLCSTKSPPAPPPSTSAPIISAQRCGSTLIPERITRSASQPQLKIERPSSVMPRCFLSSSTSSPSDPERSAVARRRFTARRACRAPKIPHAACPNEKTVAKTRNMKIRRGSRAIARRQLSGRPGSKFAVS